MSKKTLYLFLLIFASGFLCVTQDSISQTKAQVEAVDFFVKNDTLFVNYDLVKTKNDEWFEVTLTVKTLSGKVYTPASVSGHVGKFVAGGKHKQIAWAILKDNVFIDEEIYVEIRAIPMGVQQAQTQIQPPVTEQQAKVTKESESSSKPSREIVSRTYSKGGAIVLSAIIPGLGITKQKEGGAYWLMGLACYGMVAGGVILNVSANSSYNKYKEATTAGDRDTYFKKAENNAKTGNILYYSALGIWAIDMVWTILTPNKVRTTFSLKGNFDPYINKPMVSLSFKF